MSLDFDKIRVILATDCGSTTSKARFFKKLGDEYRYVTSGEAPTTVEAPYEDVTLGVRNAVREVEELTGHKLLGPDGIIYPSRGQNEGVDLYVTTSSAGGGLQMQVAGIIRTMTAESAERAALGAGAIVMDVLSIDDGREPWEKIDRMRFMRPDMILLAGGVDGGNVSHIVELAEYIRAANPQHRLGKFKLPIVYAGNKSARPQVDKILGDSFAVQMVDNVRPVLEVENPEPARDAVHHLFMEHVMSHAPGYDRLMKWTPVPIMPTPAGEGAMFQTFAKAHNANLIGVGLGGATTNVYSVYDGKFVRSVSANLGMSYSICNVLKESGLDNILRWLPFEIDRVEVRDRLRNKMIRPTTIPHTLEQLIIEHAVAREALRLGLSHHKSIARPLLGARREMTMEERLMDQDRTKTYIDMLRIDWVGGTGGLLSHAPRRVQSALILIDGFQVEGVTRLFQDSVFMIPHLGILSTVHPKAALEIFE
ncbi:MAG: glutamate mutase L [Candidatus Bathyarchaeia archaeon]